MKFKKAAAGMLSAVIMAVSAGAPAYADETATQPKFEIVTAPVGEIHNANAVWRLGRGVFCYNVTGSEKDDIDGFVYIDEDKFAETGELSYTDIKLEGFDISADGAEGLGYFTDTTFDDGDYIALYTFDEEKNQTSRFAVKYDEETGTISKFRELENKNGQIISSSGMSVSAKVNGETETCTVTVTKADGTTFDNTFSGVAFDEWGEYGFEHSMLSIVRKSDKYIYSIAFATKYNITGSGSSSSGSGTGGSWETGYYDYEFYVVDINGNAIKVDDGKLHQYAAGSGQGTVLSSDSEVFLYYYRAAMAGSPSFAFVSADGSLKRYFYTHLSDSPNAAILKDDIEPIAKLDGQNILPYQVFGDVALAMVDDDYALFDYKNNKVLGSSYKSVSTQDNGKTFLVKNNDGKWGYIDANGNRQGEMFDDASSFIGDYAAIVKDGKAYWIDRDMNVISDGIPAVGGYTLGKKLAQMNTEDGAVLMTFAESTQVSKTDFTDEKTNIHITVSVGAFDEDVTLSVTAISADTTADSSAFDIKFVNADGSAVQPNGKVTVKIPVPKALMDKTVYVFRIENSKYTDMNAKVENGYAVFTTDHFSEYIITAENLNAPGNTESGSENSTGSDNSNAASSEGTSGSGSDNPSTGFAAVSVLSIAAIVGVVVIITKRKK